MMLNAVVLPDPFGPISAVIVPSATEKLQPSTAVTPPKRLLSLSTSNSAVIAARPTARRSSPGPRTALAANDAGALRLSSLSPLALIEQALRDRRQDSARQEQHDDQENSSVGQEIDLARPEIVGEILLSRHPNERTDDRAP